MNNSFSFCDEKVILESVEIGKEERKYEHSRWN